MKQIVLKKVDINSLITLFNRSLTVSSILDFTISSDKIHSIVQNDAATFWKEWEVGTDGIFTSDPFDEFKVLIYSGSFFVQKILSIFSKSKDVQITFDLSDENVPTQILIQEFENNLKIAVPTTRIELAADGLTNEEYQTLFDKSNAIASFELKYETLQAINKLKSLSYSAAAKPVISVTFKGCDGKIVAFDGTFERTILNEYTGTDFEVKINKSLLSLINPEDHIVYLCDTVTNETEFQRFVFVSKHSVIKATDVAILMKDLTVADNTDNDSDDWANW